jgi:hypothetical protein
VRSIKLVISSKEIYNQANTAGKGIEPFHDDYYIKIFCEIDQ